jgi:hypothetical protein
LFVFLASVTKTSVDEFDKQVQEKRVTTTWINNRNKQSVYYLINVRFQTHLIEQRMNPVSIGRSFLLLALPTKARILCLDSFIIIEYNSFRDFMATRW